MRNWHPGPKLFEVLAHSSNFFVLNNHDWSVYTSRLCTLREYFYIFDIVTIKQVVADSLAYYYTSAVCSFVNLFLIIFICYYLYNINLIPTWYSASWLSFFFLLIILSGALKFGVIIWSITFRFCVRWTKSRLQKPQILLQVVDSN